ncbi:MAG: hypothetical protein WCP55_21400 [Lentisphaerota bacterium]
MKRAVITLGEPIVISQADPSVKDWGAWQFPSLSLMADGGLHLSYHTHSDSAAAYGRENPHMVSYDNGVTLLSYGRPGFFLRATIDPAGLEWGERIQILEQGHGTCSYSGLVAIDSNSAFVTYSDFAFPNGEGVPVKTILGRHVTIKPE